MELEREQEQELELMKTTLLKQCRDALIRGRQLLSVSQSELVDDMWERDLAEWMNGHAALIASCDAELARTDGPSEVQIRAATMATSGR